MAVLVGTKDSLSLAEGATSRVQKSAPGVRAGGRASAVQRNQKLHVRVRTMGS